MKKTYCLILMVLVVTTKISSQNVIVVDPAGGGNYETIVAAIAGASNGDTIKVMPGWYVESISINKPIHLKAIDTTCVIRYPGGLGSTAAATGGSISGFKIQIGAGFSGNNFLVIGNIFENVTISSGSGTLNLVYSQNEFRGCTINLAMGAGNVSFVDNILYSSTVSSSNSAYKSYILHNSFNSSTLSSSISGTASKVISKNTFIQTVNTVTSSSISSSSNKKIVFSENSISGGGTGVSVGAKTLVVANSITGTAVNGIFIGLSSYISIFANTVINNANNGIFIDQLVSISYNATNDSIVIKNNVINQNKNGIRVQLRQNNNFAYSVVFSNYEITNNILRGNLEWGLINQNDARFFSGLIKVKNNVFSSNTLGGIALWAQFSITDYNCLFGNGNNNASGLGNIIADPQFVNPAENNFKLAAASPCINAGSPSTLEFDLDKSRNDMGIYGGSYNWDNFYGNSSGAKVLELGIRPLNTQAGSTIIISGSGAASRSSNAQVIDARKDDSKK